MTWNSNGIRNKTSELTYIMRKHNIQIVLLTETRLNPNINFHIPQYKIYRNDRDGASGGGTAILIHEDIVQNSTLTPQLNTIEATTASITVKNTKIIVAAIYKRPQNTLDTNDLETVMNLNRQVIIGGDMNAHHQLWNCKRTNRDGRSIHDMIFRNLQTYKIIYPEEPTYYPSDDKKSPSTIDFFITKNIHTRQLARTISETDSDHNPVYTKIYETPERYTERSYIVKYNYKKADWTQFKDDVSNQLDLTQTILTRCEIDQEVRKLTELIQHSIKKNIPKINKQSYEQLPEHIIKLIQVKNSIRRKWQKQRVPELKALLNKFVSEIQRHIRKHKNDIWKLKLDNINKDSTNLWKLTKNRTRKRNDIPPLHSRHNGVVYSNKDKADAIAEVLEETHRQNLDLGNIQHDHKVNKTVQHNKQLNTPICRVTPLDVKQNIKKLKNYKAPGLDNIQNIVLKNLPRKAIINFTKIINAMLSLEHYPVEWKAAKTLPFPKPGKSDTFPQNYRPISLLPTMGKLAEKIIQKQILYHIKKKNVLPKHQYGFRSGHATQHPINILTEKTIHAMNMKKHTGLVSLDIQKAFDTVWHNGLLYKLQKIELPRYLINIIRSYLKNRTFRVCVKNELSDEKAIAAGLPQGSILAPLLFNIYMHDIPTHKNTQILQYADDTAIFSASAKIEILTKKLQEHLLQIDHYLDTWKLKLNTQKTEAILFTNKQKQTIDKQKTLQIGADKIPWANTIKYLGVIFDKKLSFKEHTKYRNNQASAAINRLHCLLNNSSYLNKQNKRLLYLLMIRPILTYAGPAWTNTCKYNYQKLQRTQNKCLRLITGKNRQQNNKFITNKALHEEAKIPYIKEFIATITKKFYMAINNHKNQNITDLGKFTRKNYWTDKRLLPNF